MPRCWEVPGSPRCCSDPAVPGFTASRNTSRCRTSCAAATLWPRWRAAGAWRSRGARRPCSGSFAQDEPLRHQHVTARVAFIALTRSAAADVPARRVVAARRAAHVHALAFEVQHRVVTAQTAEKLADTPHRTIRQALAVVRVHAGRRELLGIIRNHFRFTLSSRTPALILRFRPRTSGISTPVPRSYS